MTSRDYRIFALGQTISVSGIWMQKLAQAWLVLVLTNSGLLLGVTVALQQLPTLLFTASGGGIADRFDRRRILMVTNTAGMLPALALGVIVWLDVAQLWMVMVAALVQGFAEAMEKPARMTLVNDIVGPRLLPNAITLNNIIQNSGKLVGPAIAGILIGTAGLAAAFFANAASFVPVVIGLAMMRPRYLEERTRKWRGSLKDSWGYVTGRRDLALALALTLVAGLFGFNFSVTVPLLFRDVFDGNAQQVGFGLTSIGLGGVVGGLAVAGRIRADERGTVSSAAIFGLTLILLAAAPSLPIAYVIGFLVGTTSVTFLATSASHIQLTADRDMRGRMMGFYVMVASGSGPIGGPMLGGISQLFSARVAFAFGGIMVAGAAAVAHRWSRAAAGPRSGAELAREPTAEQIAAVEQAEALVVEST